MVAGWTPKIGDPTLYGWATVFAYAVAALLCWRASSSSRGSESKVWMTLALVMAALTINKQLDLQTLMTALGRSIAKAHGWYHERRIFQSVFIAFLCGVGTAILAALLWKARRMAFWLKGAIVGTAVLLVFVLVRASSFYKVDILINQSWGGIRTNHLMELGGIAIVAVSAAASARAQR